MPPKPTMTGRRDKEVKLLKERNGENILYIIDFGLSKRFIINNPGIIVLSHVTYKSSYRYPIKEINKFCRENKKLQFPKKLD